MVVASDSRTRSQFASISPSTHWAPVAGVDAASVTVISRSNRSRSSLTSPSPWVKYRDANPLPSFRNGSDRRADYNYGTKSVQRDCLIA